MKKFWRALCIWHFRIDWREDRIARNAATVHLYGEYSQKIQRVVYWLWWGLAYEGLKQQCREKL